MLERQQLPQALLLQGPAGVGRRYLGLDIAARLLRVAVPGVAAHGITDGESGLGHPDFLEVTPAVDKRSISVDQVRDVISFQQLTGLKGRDRVVMVVPADAMTLSAANSLLKTLEEPPDGSMIILITESAARLPATLLSRCHRLTIGIPGRTEALSWLRRFDPDENWDLLLQFALDAPFAALQLQRNGFAAQAARYQEDLDAISRGRTAARMVAKRWALADPGILLRWLYGHVSRSVRQACESDETAGTRRLQNVADRLYMRRLIQRLRLIEEVYRTRDTGLNHELQLMALLMDWQDTTTDAKRGG